MQRRPNTQTVQWFLELHSSGQLDLAPAYQRRSVWNESYRRYYVDTVLRDYPSPAIFLQIETRPGSPTVYHVIDGKQRLETLIGFTLGEFHLAGYFESEGLSSPYFSDLPERMQESFVDYVISVENITRADTAELKAAFDRLNRNTAKLNNQELRKAQFEGAFITKMTELASAPFWERIGMASRARVQRMLDVEFVSEIYLLSMSGIHDGNSDILDNAYAEYDEVIPDEEETDARYHEVLRYLENLDLEWRRTRWKNVGDFYGLWAALLDLLPDDAPGPAEAVIRLLDFEQGVADRSYPWAQAYGDAVRQGTNKDTSRAIRADLLMRALAGKDMELPNDES